MTDGEQNKGVPAGKEDNNVNEEDKKDISEFEKLKTSNDEFEKELIRGRELKAESQKLEAEKMLAGTSGGNVVSEKVSPKKAKENKAEKFFENTALGDAIKKANE